MSRRLVDDEQRRIADHGAGDANALAHAAGEVAQLAARVCLQPRHGQEPFHFGPAPARAGDAAFESPVIEELRRGQAGVGVELLRQEPDALAIRRQRLRPHVDAGVADDATGRQEEPGQDAQQRRLSRAVGTEQSDHARLQLE